MKHNKTPTFIFNDRINQKKISGIITKMEKMSPKTLILNSPGGEVDAAIKFCEYLRLRRSKIDVQVLGQASSAATLILASATGERIMTKNSYLMYHNIYTDSFNSKTTSTTLLDEYKSYRFFEKILENIYGQRSEATRDFYVNNVLKSEKDIFVNSADALRFGLIDRII